MKLAVLTRKTHVAIGCSYIIIKFKNTNAIKEWGEGGEGGVAIAPICCAKVCVALRLHIQLISSLDKFPSQVLSSVWLVLVYIHFSIKRLLKPDIAFATPLSYRKKYDQWSFLSKEKNDKKNDRESFFFRNTLGYLKNTVSFPTIDQSNFRKPPNTTWVVFHRKHRGTICYFLYPPFHYYIDIYISLCMYT